MEKRKLADRTRTRTSTSDPAHTNDVYGMTTLPSGLLEAIEMERDNLSMAESLLGCMADSMETESDPANKPYYPDVARLARQLVKQSINGLDSSTLQQFLLRNKVRETLALGASSALH